MVLLWVLPVAGVFDTAKFYCLMSLIGLVFVTCTLLKVGQTLWLTAECSCYGFMLVKVMEANCLSNLRIHAPPSPHTHNNRVRDGMNLDCDIIKNVQWLYVRAASHLPLHRRALINVPGFTPFFFSFMLEQKCGDVLSRHLGLRVSDKIPVRSLRLSCHRYI